MANEQKQYSSNWEDYNFSKEEKVGTITIVKDVTKNDIETVIVNSFEGGSNYWMYINSNDKVWEEKPNGIPYSTWATQMLIDNKEVPIYDAGSDTPNKPLILTLAKVMNGISLNALHRDWDADLENGDATTSDCILQYSVFDDVLYG